jgi:cellulose synthase/poly-beta-1,6-N-acetylglucosamine synthase-like glycosyltransferase
MTEIIYTPGVCNIGPEEIAQRKKVGAIGLVATIIISLALLYWDVAPVIRIVLFLPAFVAASGLIQAYGHFCFAFGNAGIFNFGTVGTTQTVTDPEALKKDKQQAFKLMAYSVIAALIYTAFIFFI